MHPKLTPHFMAVLALLVLIPDTNEALAQTGSSEILWQKSFGGTGDDTLNVIKPTSDSGFILGGYSISGISGNKTNAGFGDYDYWVVKIDAQGEKQWDRSYGGTSEDKLYTLLPTADGGYLLGGYSASAVSGNKGGTNYGWRDFWLVKIDAGGNLQWDQSYGGTEAEELHSIQPAGDGGYFLGGLSGSPVSGNKGSTNWGSVDYWLVKVDAAGVKQWDRAFGTTGSDWSFCMLTNNTGGVMLGGEAPPAVSGNKTNAGFGSSWYDCWLVNVDANGEIQSQSSFGGSVYDYLYAMQRTSDGGLLLGSTSASAISGNKTNSGYGSFDYWLVKLDANGDKQWDQSIGGGSDEELHDIQGTTDGGYLLAGNTWSGVSGNKSSSNFGQNDYWLVKVDAEGNKQWEQTFGGSSRDECHGLALTSDGGCLVAGNSASGIDGNKTTSGFGNYDFWIVRLGTPLRFVSYALDSNQAFHAQLNGLPGTNYIFQASTNLTDWVSLATNNASDGQVIFSDTNAPAFPLRAYRAQQLP